MEKKILTEEEVKTLTKPMLHSITESIKENPILNALIWQGGSDKEDHFLSMLGVINGIVDTILPGTRIVMDIDDDTHECKEIYFAKVE